MPDDNLQLWNSVGPTDPAYTKAIKGKAYRGTAINPTWIVRKLTELFGPAGKKWQLNVEEEKILEGHAINDHDRVKIHVIKGFLEYTYEGKASRTPPQFGQTIFVGENKHGVFTDEDAPKKSITDCLCKCAVFLGIGADIHLGEWDSNKHVAPTPEGKPSADRTGLQGCGRWNADQWRDYLEGVEDLAQLRKIYAQCCAATPERMPSKESLIQWEKICKVFSDRFLAIDKPGPESDQIKQLFREAKEQIVEASKPKDEGDVQEASPSEEQLFEGDGS